MEEASRRRLSQPYQRAEVEMIVRVINFLTRGEAKHIGIAVGIPLLLVGIFLPAFMDTNPFAQWSFMVAVATVFLGALVVIYRIIPEEESKEEP